jgi:Cys-tRNA(Pro) deacylase
MSAESLKEYLEKMGVDAKFYKFEKHTMTAEAAAKRLGVSLEKIIKSIIFIDDSGSPVLAIVTGDKKISEKKLAMACGAKRIRIATPDEVKKLTGYDVGGVPPVGHKVSIRTFIDKKVMSLDKVIGGGGEINVVLEISPAEIKNLTNAEVKDISEP